MRCEKKIQSTFSVGVFVVVVECGSMRAEAKRLVKLPCTLCQVTKARHKGQIHAGQFHPYKVLRAGKFIGTECKGAVTGN